MCIPQHPASRLHLVAPHHYRLAFVAKEQLFKGVKTKKKKKNLPAFCIRFITSFEPGGVIFDAFMYPIRENVSEVSVPGDILCLDDMEGFATGDFVVRFSDLFGFNLSHRINKVAFSA